MKSLAKVLAAVILVMTTLSFMSCQVEQDLETIQVSSLIPDKLKKIDVLNDYLSFYKGNAEELNFSNIYFRNNEVLTIEFNSGEVGFYRSQSGDYLVLTTDIGKKIDAEKLESGTAREPYAEVCSYSGVDEDGFTITISVECNISECQQVVSAQAPGSSVPYSSTMYIGPPNFFSIAIGCAAAFAAAP